MFVDLLLMVPLVLNGKGFTILEALLSSGQNRPRYIRPHHLLSADRNASLFVSTRNIIKGNRCASYRVDLDKSCRVSIWLMNDLEFEEKY
jgi:hypothetical protein